VSERQVIVLDSIDVDVGGTFCDLVLTISGDRYIVKSPTTPHDLSICFMNAIDDCARVTKTTTEALLSRVQVIRYSTTVALNRLIQRQGPRIGLMATEGHEDAILIGRGAQWVDGKRVAERRNLAIQTKPVPLVSREHIVGIRERIDSLGNVIRPLDEEDCRIKLRHLVDRGVRAIVVSLLSSFSNPAHERRVKQLIREEYKEYHVGYLPVVLSSDVVAKRGEYARTMTAVLDAYLHQAMQMEMSATWDKLRSRGYKGSFLMIHNSGGSADTFKTSACRTFNGGPVAGLMGSAHFAAVLGYKNVVATDMGGTSFDIGLVIEDSVRTYDFRPVIDTWMVGVTMLQTISIGAGGGSIASIDKFMGNRIDVGPRSAGSMPGPACYNMGGSEPTVTDADLVLGYLNPDAYFGGKMPLNKSRAERAIRDKIALPLGITVEKAAALIRHIVDQNMASAIRREVHLRGYKPEDFVIFAFGGAGPTHACGFKADIPKAIIFPASPVFCALGSSVMDVAHVYEMSKRLIFMEAITEKFTTDYASFNAVVERLIAQAKQDLSAEGLPLDQAVFSLELDMLYGGQVNVKRMSSPLLLMHSPQDVEAIYAAFEKEFSEAFSPLVINRPGGVYLDNFILRASLPTIKPACPTYELIGEDPSDARVGSRPVYWPEYDGYVETDAFALDKLRPGNRVSGPAIVEASFTTLVIPPGSALTVDAYGFGILQHDSAAEGLGVRRQRHVSSPFGMQSEPRKISTDSVAL
jgi:N-methylhydantoinase A/oxoprolinase/acetone carboxylase beta subunit